MVFISEKNDSPSSISHPHDKVLVYQNEYTRTSNHGSENITVTGVPLLDAIRGKQTETVKLLLEKKVDPNAKAMTGETALRIAVEKQVPEILGLLLKHGANVNEEYGKGRTALFRACAKGDIVSVEILIQHGADVNYQDNNGSTPLMAAAHSQNPQLVVYLCENGAKTSLQNKQGLTALKMCPERSDVSEVLKRHINRNKQTGITLHIFYPFSHVI